MPKKPMKACAASGCSQLFSGAGIYCPEHAKAESKRYERYERTPEAKKRYGYQWRKIRQRFLNSHPLCEECRKNGRYVTATEVHHILPLGHGGTNDYDNLMALCKSCHSRISVEMGDRFHRRKPIEG